MSIEEFEVRPSLTRIEDVRQFLARLWSPSARQSTVFVGAGISVPTPSCLPSAKDVIEQVIHALAGHPALDAQYRDLLGSVQEANVKLEFCWRSYRERLPQTSLRYSKSLMVLILISIIISSRDC
jgi:hypothetical protein